MFVLLAWRCLREALAKGPGVGWMSLSSANEPLAADGCCGLCQRRLDLLIVDDDEEYRCELVCHFERQGHRVQQSADEARALELAQRTAFDVAVVEMGMPDLDGLELLGKLKAASGECEVIILADEVPVEAAVEAVKSGAFCYLRKPVRLGEVETSVMRAGDAVQLHRENRQLRAALKRSEPRVEMIGESPPMQDVFRLIERTAATVRPVLIQGERGTGKGLVARTVHGASRLADRPLIVINCAAQPPSRLEGELFGHERGAFTGAVTSMPGLVEMADGGTLFLDEIAELAWPLQARLLRVLDGGRLRRAGSMRERRVSVRLVAATRRELANEVSQGRFREDLYYRINGLTIDLPPLRERTADIPLLADHFTGPDHRVQPEVVSILQNYLWPGNVRQLKHTLARAKVLASEWIRVDHLPSRIVRQSRASPLPSRRTCDLQSITRRYVLDTYERCQRNKARTARALGIGRRSLYRMLEKYGV
jgi:DNA-binding NtrC family response regulator